MKFIHPPTLSELACLLGRKYVGDGDQKVSGINEIHRVESGDIIFVDHPKYYQKALQSEASFIIINQETDCPEGKGLIISPDPFSDYNFIVSYYFGKDFNLHTIHPSAEIHPSALIHPSVIIGQHCIIEEGCILHPNVTLYDNVIIRKHAVIHAGTILGSDGFYYKRRETHYEKMNSCGGVIIEEHCEIGAGCTIDKGVSSYTTVGAGTKIDNQVHIGHDTIIGQNCLIAAQVGIAGCVTIGNRVTIWGQVGITSGIHIGDDAIIYAQSGVDKSLPGKQKYFGSPADEASKKFREMAGIRQLIEFFRKQS